ncbi:unnamed protein product [Closterium sp. NIES-64]|nr:unnamed protein product [Closterium sp. NIES-64]
MAAAAPSGDADVEDYMGDLSAFLPPEDASKLRDQQQERQKKLPKPAPRQRPDDWKRLTWQERRQQVREEKDKAEAAVLAEGLAAPIPPSNIGFKLLQKMGFKGPPEAERTGGMAGFSSAGKMGVAEIRGERHRGDGARVGEESGVTAGRETSRERGKAECTGGDVTGEREKTLVTEAGSSRSLTTRVGEYCSDQRPAESTGEASIEDNLGESGVPATAPNRKPLVWVEPVALSLKRDRKGLGKEEEEEEAERQKLLRAEAAARVRRRGEEALRGDFEERRKGRWSEWKVRGALRKARTALVHLEGGEEWLRSQAVRIGAAPSSTDSHGGGGSGLRKARTALVHLEGGEEWLRSQALRTGAASSSSGASPAVAAASGGAQLDGAGFGGRGGGAAAAALSRGAGAMERGVGAERGWGRRRRVRKKRIVTECDADGEGALLLPGGCSVAARRVLCCCQEGALLLPGGCSVAARRVLCCCQEGALLLPGGCSVAARCIESYESEEALASMCLYESEEALASMCPGEEEEAH